MPAVAAGSNAGHIEQYLEAFESRLARGDAADLADFLPPQGNAAYRSVLRELIRIDLDFRWSKKGRPLPLTDYQNRFPEAFADDADRAAIAFEEYRQRLQAGESPTPEEYQRRYNVATSNWPQPDRDETYRRSIAALLEEAAEAPLTRVALHDDGDYEGNADHRPEASLPQIGAPATLPEPGTEFLGFRLLRVLGKGAFGRVYLAEQADLAHRPVALKVSTDIGGESQRLAQLQHANIVPIYSTHRSGSLQAVCMPYFGSTTLADVIRAVNAGPSIPTSGRELVSTLHARRSTTPGLTDAASTSSMTEAFEPAAPVACVPEFGSAVILDKLASLNYVDAVLWLAERLTDGLAHAHERGIWHCDLKPANILLADEGQPMLLDFNLAVDANLRCGAGAVRGGTLAYMAPEHLQAVINKGGPIDGRSDLYALGVILFELLAGRHPSPPEPGRVTPEMIRSLLKSRQQAAPRLQAHNAAVTPAVEAIVRRCLEPNPKRRYPSARALQEDVQRQLASLPLKHTHEPSLRERGRKWMRRHPRLASSSAVAALAVLLVAGLAALTAGWLRQLAVLQADAALRQFRKDAGEARFLLTHVNEQAYRERGLARCQTALEHFEALENPEWRHAPIFLRLPEAERGKLVGEIGEMLLLYTSATLPPPGEAVKRPDDVQRALERNTLAGACFAEGRSPRAWGLQRARILQLLGRDEDAKRTRLDAEQQPLRTAHDYYLAAREHFVAGRFRDAMPLLQEALDLDPEHYWATFLQARCYDQFGDQRAAVACYRTCIALQPGQHAAWFNRGLAYLRQRDYRRAVADFDQAEWLRADQAELAFNRALARLGLQQQQQALADLDRAEQLGCALTRIYFVRARVREQLGDKEGAQRDRALGLRLEPADDLSWNARGFARLSTDAKGALHDFERALEQNPRSLPALENKAHVLAELLKRPADAVAALDQAVALYPDHVAARASRGVLRARLGQRDAALEDAREALLRNADPPTQYQVAGIYALTARQQPDDARQALSLLAAALRHGYGLDLVDGDSDLDPIRDRPEFRQLVQGAKSLQP